MTADSIIRHIDYAVSIETDYGHDDVGVTDLNMLDALASDDELWVVRFNGVYKASDGRHYMVFFAHNKETFDGFTLGLDVEDTLPKGWAD